MAGHRIRLTDTEYQKFLKTKTLCYNIMNDELEQVDYGDVNPLKSISILDTIAIRLYGETEDKDYFLVISKTQRALCLGHAKEVINND